MFNALHNKPLVLVQGITGRHGSFHTKNMMQAGTAITAGVTPGKADHKEHGIPVYDTVADALRHHKISISVIFVPPAFAKAALLEAIENNIRFIVCVTEGIPVHDMLEVRLTAQQHGCTIIGPNCPGLLVPGSLSLGIIPLSVSKVGSVALVSRSGTLTYEVAASLSAAGVGQCYIIGIGGDRLRGTGFVECLKAFQDDPEVTSIVLIGEIGGSDEQKAADYIASSVTKPVFAYVVGHSAPPQKQLGHAGAIMGSPAESAAERTKALAAAGAITAASLDELIRVIVEKTRV